MNKEKIEQLLQSDELSLIDLAYTMGAPLGLCSEKEYFINLCEYLIFRRHGWDSLIYEEVLFSGEELEDRFSGFIWIKPLIMKLPNNADMWGLFYLLRYGTMDAFNKGKYLFASSAIEVPEMDESTGYKRFELAVTSLLEDNYDGISHFHNTGQIPNNWPTDGVDIT